MYALRLLSDRSIESVLSMGHIVIPTEANKMNHFFPYHEANNGNIIFAIDMSRYRRSTKQRRIAEIMRYLSCGF